MLHKKISPMIAALLAVSVLALVCPATGLAHRVTIFAWSEGGTIHTESKFSGGAPVHEGKIEVYDASSDELLLHGKTDEQGNFCFPIPDQAIDRKTDLRIVIHGGAGHLGEWTVSADEYPPRLSDAPTVEEAAHNPQTPAQSAATNQAEQPPGFQPTMHSLPRTPEIEQAVEKIMDQKLAPIYRTLNELKQDRIGLTEILGGIGYIIGLAGTAMYFSNRRKE